MARTRRLKDVDVTERLQRIRLIPFAFLMGIAGAAVGSKAALALGLHPYLGGILGMLIGGVGFFFAIPVLAEAAGRSVGFFLFPSGRSTPRPPDYSRAESLVIRGELEEAVAEYRAHADEAPLDTEPRLRLARIYRDRLADHDEAVAWLRRALEVASDAGGAHHVLRELVELLVTRMGEPERALPELARFAERHPGTTAGKWAARELTLLREVVWRSAPGSASDREWM